MTSSHKLALTAGLALATALTLSCSGDGGSGDNNPGGTSSENIASSSSDAVSSSSVVSSSSSSVSSSSSEPAHVHAWGEWSVTNPANCGKKGVRTRACAIDPSHVETEVIDELPYDNATLLCDSRDGKLYKFVAIGTQKWMAENLNYNVPGNVTNLCYDSDPANCAKYGRLYDWATSMSLPSKCNSILSTGDAECSITSPDHRDVCPSGWHIPSNDEWNALMKSVNPACSDNSNCATELKAASGWNPYDGVPASTDEFGFSALPGGLGNTNGNFSNAGDIGFWWSASERNSNVAYSRNMYYNNEFAYYDYYDKSNLFSVRCLQD